MHWMCVVSLMAETPALAALQGAMMRALLAEDAAGRAAPEPWLQGPEAARDGLHVHRNTVIGGCWNALRLSYPSLERWLGETAFAALAADFARLHPPAEPALTRYGEAFGGYAASRLPDARRPLVRALAGFDWLFERVAQSAPAALVAGTAVPLGEGVRLYLAPGLRLHASAWPVETLREQLLALPAVAAPASLEIPATRGLRHRALWRSAQGVHVQPLSGSAAALVGALLDGAPLAAALDAAAVAEPVPGAASGSAAGPDEHASSADADLVQVLEREVLRAGFARLVSVTTPGPQERSDE